MNTPKINEALKAFKNIDGSNYYPQIYIPKFEHEEDMREEKNYTAPNTNAATEQIVYIYYSGDSEVDSATNETDSYAGYVLDSSNNLVYWGMVNEEYANDNEVWIISINESVGNGGNFCPPQFENGVNFYCPEAINGCCTSPPPPPPPPGGCNGDPNCDPTMFAPTTIPFPDLGHNKVNFKIAYMVVKDGKESWLAGRSEVAIRAVLHCHNDRELGNPSPAVERNYTSTNTANYLGNLIRKYKRREINRGTIVDINYSLQTDWQNSNHLKDPVYFDYVIFERDVWPAPKQVRVRQGREDRLQNPFSTANSYKLDYRSGKSNHSDGREQPYSQGGFINVTNSFIPLPYDADYYDGTSIINNTIGFKTIKY